MLRNSIFLAAVLVCLQAFAQPVMTLSPALITTCNSSGYGQVRVYWSNAGPGPVTVHVGGPTGIAFTGRLPFTGQADTGYWVVDGTVFSLVDSNSQELARVTARVRCAPSTLTSGSYFPLAVGNEWVYKELSRLGGPYYFNRRVTGVRVDASGTLWFVVGDSTSSAVGGTTPVSETLYRIDDQGRVHRMSQTGVDEIYLDPTGGPATLVNLSQGQTLLTSLGVFPDSLSYTTTTGGLIQERGYFVRGLGLSSNVENLLTGSSGGFTQSMDLIYARISGQRYSLPQPALDLSAEATDLYVTARYVTNCALPCYFVACGLGGPAPDPPGTYKPCFEARVRLSGPYTSTAQTVALSLVDAIGNVIDSLTTPVTGDTAAEELVIARQLKLYSAPNVGVPPGLYQLKVTLTANGAEAASSMIGVNVW